MRRLFRMLPACCLLGAIVASPAPALSTTPTGHSRAIAPTISGDRHLDFDGRATLVCSREHLLMRTAWEPGRAAPSPKSCFRATERIGAGYTRLLSTSVLKRPHHTIRG